MSISKGAGIQITGPACVESWYGIFSVADVEDRDIRDSFHHDQLPCDDLLVVSSWCEPHVKTASAVGPEFPVGDPFAVVAGYKCATVGDTLGVAWDRAEERLDQGESRSVERTFWSGLDSLGNVVRESLGQNPDVTDLTPAGGAVSITDGLARLERWAGGSMSCQPVVHVEPGIAIYLEERNLISAIGKTMRVRATGSRVSVGGGYLLTGPGGDVPADGEGWIFITGGIKILRSPAFFTPSKDDPAAAVDRAINNVEVFAEKTFGFALGECGVAAIRVVLASCCPDPVAQSMAFSTFTAEGSQTPEEAEAGPVPAAEAGDAPEASQTSAEGPETGTPEVTRSPLASPDSSSSGEATLAGQPVASPDLHVEVDASVVVSPSEG